MQISARAGDVHAVGGVHEVFELLHGGQQLAEIHQTAAEIKFLELFRTQGRLLSHRRRGPAQHAPLGVRNPLFLHGLEVFHGQFHLFGRHGGIFESVEGAPNGDVGVHVFHLVERMFADHFILLVGGAGEHFAGDGAVGEPDVGAGPGASDGADESHGHFIGCVAQFEQNMFPRPELGRILDEESGQLIESWVFHNR